MSRLTKAQRYVLRFCSEHRGFSVRAMALALDLSTSTVRISLAGLNDLGYLVSAGGSRTRPNDHDLTPAGVEVLGRVAIYFPQAAERCSDFGAAGLGGCSDFGSPVVLEPVANSLRTAEISAPFPQDSYKEHARAGATETRPDLYRTPVESQVGLGLRCEPSLEEKNALLEIVDVFEIGLSENYRRDPAGTDSARREPVDELIRARLLALPRELDLSPGRIVAAVLDKLTRRAARFRGRLKIDHPRVLLKWIVADLTAEFQPGRKPPAWAYGQARLTSAAGAP